MSSWTSLDHDDATSSSDGEDIVGENTLPGQKVHILHKTRRPEKKSLYSEHEQDSQLDKSYGCSSRGKNIEKNGQPQHQLQNLLAIKDERICALQKLINGQREQLYHFLKMSVNEETLLELKKTCRETEALHNNENICMALDKFKYDNSLPTEQTLVREDISRTLFKVERLMKRQARVMKILESSDSEGKKQVTENNAAVICFTRDDQLTDVQKLVKSTKQIERRLEILKFQLKKLALIEEERIDLIERVHSLPSDQRQYYAHLTVFEKEKNDLRSEIDRLTENYRDLKHKCSLLEGAEQELKKSVSAKIADLDVNKIRPGLETHLEVMEMVQRGELTSNPAKKDAKETFTDDLIKVFNENAEIAQRLQDFDKAMKERDDLKRQIEVLVENCFRLQNEVKALRLASKTDDLLQQLRQACLEREQFRVQLERLTKEGPGVLRICGETASKVAGERDQLRLKLAEYLTMEEDMRSLRFTASQAEAYRVEAERLKEVVAELEEVKAAHIALLDKNGKNPCVVSPLDRDMYRNMTKQLEHFKEVEKQRERLVLEVSRYKYALLKQEEEIKDLVCIVDKLTDQVKVLKTNPTAAAVNPAEGTPEGPEATPALSPEDEKRMEHIRNRILQHDTTSHRTIPQPEVTSKSTSETTTFIDSVKSFLGLHKSLTKAIE